MRQAGRRRRLVLDGIPQGDHRVRKSLQCAVDSGDGAHQIVALFLVGRIDEQQRAPFRRGKMGGEAAVTIRAFAAHARKRLQRAFERTALGGLDLEAPAAILRPQRLRGQERRARVMRGFLRRGRAEAPNGAEVGADLRVRAGRLLQHADAEARFGALVRGRTAQIVESPARVGLQVQETLVLALQGCNQRQQRDVLVHVGKVSRMKAMTILHVRARGARAPVSGPNGAWCWFSSPALSSWPRPAWPAGPARCSPRSSQSGSFCRASAPPSWPPPGRRVSPPPHRRPAPRWPPPWPALPARNGPAPPWRAPRAPAPGLPPPGGSLGPDPWAPGHSSRRPRGTGPS